VNPTLNQQMPWLYFVLCQVGFGLVAGFVVSRQGQVHHAQHLPLTSRVGVEVPQAPADLPEEEFMDQSGRSEPPLRGSEGGVSLIDGSRLNPCT
jgi:hypothetical protein